MNERENKMNERENKMNERRIASELLKLAKELVGIDFPTQDAMDKYLKEHPDADKTNHRVVKTKKDIGKSPRKTMREVTDRALDDIEEEMGSFFGNKRKGKQFSDFMRTTMKRDFSDRYDLKQVEDLVSNAADHVGLRREEEDTVRDAVSQILKKHR